MKKVRCANTNCKYNDCHDGCKSYAKININGECENFEKGFVYYFRLVWSALHSKNYIDAIELTDDLRIGLYYVMSVYNLGFYEMEWGTCRMIMLKKDENGAALKYEDIIALGMNKEKFNELLKDFENGILPGITKAQEKNGGDMSEMGFGWLSPSGEFKESPFGEHEESAAEICERKEFETEYDDYAEKRVSEGKMSLHRDFLMEVKGYCLIHNPSNDGGYIVTQPINLTKKQREFLYGYFIDKGDRFKAEQFLTEDVTL